MCSEVPGKYDAMRLPYKNSSSLAAVLVLPDESYASVVDGARDITRQMVITPMCGGPCASG